MLSSDSIHLYMPSNQGEPPIKNQKDTVIVGVQYSGFPATRWACFSLAFFGRCIQIHSQTAARQAMVAMNLKGVQGN